MTEKARELLSALIDGEASEIEIHRLLRRLGEDDSLIDAWVSYQETRRVLRSPSNTRAESGFHLNSRQHLELHRRISQAIEDDNSYSDVTNTSRPAALFTGTAAALAKPAALITTPAAVLAMAASLVVAVFIGIQVNTPQSNDIASESQAIGSQTIGSQIRQPQSVAAQSVTTGLAQGNEPIADDLELKELDEEGQRRLRAYLNQHDRILRMKPNTSLVTYPNQPNN